MHFFTLVLGYSRRLYAKGFLDEKFVNLVNGHESAFQWFGGLTREILYDNAKTMITLHNIHTGDLLLNSAFKDFADSYGFEARFCRPYRPQTKGKIESGVKYVKHNFLPGRRFESLAHLNKDLERWMVETADERIHGTTHQRPSQRFLEEQHLLFNRNQPYVYVPAIQRKVSQDSMVSFNRNCYSVPWCYVGHCVDLRLSQNKLFITVEGTVIATHELLQGKHQLSVCQHHYAGLLRPLPRKQQPVLPQHDPYWPKGIEVETRDLAIYEKVSLIPLMGESYA